GIAHHGDRRAGSSVHAVSLQRDQLQPRDTGSVRSHLTRTELQAVRCPRRKDGERLTIFSGPDAGVCQPNAATAMLPLEARQTHSTTTFSGGLSWQTTKHFCARGIRPHFSLHSFISTSALPSGS